MATALSLATSSAAAQGQQRRPVELPDGDGKQVVQVLCTQCHTLNNVANSGGYTREGWKELIRSMVSMRAEREDTVATYLAAHFPVKPRPEAVRVPGDATVVIREWMLPTLGQRPHDPAPGPDGSIWWTGQWNNVLGRLDPATGAMREYTL
ncbi:MAG: hypothetical protein WDZ58_00805, partial [Gemmatimonadaceae bacterium]